jgi:hypothetical protein
MPAFSEKQQFDRLAVDFGVCHKPELNKPPNAALFLPV